MFSSKSCPLPTKVPDRLKLPSSLGLRLVGLLIPEGGIYIAGMSKFDDLVIEADTTFDRGRSLFVMKMEDGSSSAGGRVWYDINNNGAQDAGELPYALKALADESGKIIAFTTRSGKYRLPLEEGMHTVLTAQMPTYFDVDPPVRSYVINQTTAPGPDTLDFRLIPQIIAEDVEVVATALGPPVPGQVTRFQIDCRNKGTLPITGTVNLWPDSRLYYSSMNPLGNLDGGRIFWYVNNMPPGDVRTFTADLYVEPMTMLNDQLYSTTAFEGLPGDSNPENNANTITQTVLSSYDPNDKQVDKPAVLHLPTDAGLLSQDFEYLIRFQNTGTYIAFKIVVRDTLSELLDPLSFNLISVSHPVEIRVNQGRILEFVFNNILLPDSTSNEPESHGFIKYTLRPLAAQIQVGDRINNTAHIYFDYNAPIATNTATTAIEQVTSLQPGQQFPATLLVFPNPVTNTLYIEHKGAIPDGPVTLAIVDAAGKRLVHTPWQSTLSVETLPPGMYTLLLKYEGRTWAACPFLKK